MRTPSPDSIGSEINYTLQQIKGKEKGLDKYVELTVQEWTLIYNIRLEILWTIKPF